MNLSTEAGLAQVYQEYNDDTKTNKNLSAQAGYHFDKKLNHKFKLIHDLNYFPSTEDFSDYYLTASGEVRATLTDSIFANLKIIFDYDSTPAEDAGSTDIKYMLGIGCEF